MADETYDASDWDLAAWEKALTIRVGECYVCRKCENVVMVTKGGVGVLELKCCGQPMEKVTAKPKEAE